MVRPGVPAGILPVLLSGLLLAGCAGGLFSRDDTGDAPEVPVSVIFGPGDDILRPERRPDTGAAPAAAQTRAAPAGGGVLGETLAGLGPPSEGGLWLRTGLVGSVQPGRVQSESGATLSVELRPSGREPGAGSQISLEAMQALDLPLTRLATLRVFAGQ